MLEIKDYNFGFMASIFRRQIWNMEYCLKFSWDSELFQVSFPELLTDRQPMHGSVPGRVRLSRWVSGTCNLGIIFA